MNTIKRLCVLWLMLPFATTIHAMNLVTPASQLLKAAVGAPVPGSASVRFNAEAAHQMTSGEIASLQLGDEVHAVTFERTEVNGPGTRTWIGYLSNHGTDYRVIATTGEGGTFATIHTPDGAWGMVPGRGGEWLFDAVTAQMNAPISSGATEDAVVPPEYFEWVQRRGAAKADAADPDCAAVTAKPSSQVTVDWMAVYTDDFAAHFGAANVPARIAQLVSLMNNIFAQSNVAVTLRLVHTVPVTYAATNSDSTALSAIRGGTGVFANVAALRDQYGADMVSLLRGPQSNGSISGVAYIGGSNRSPMSLYANSMFSVIGDANWNTSGRLSAHELGHNFGNLHDRANSGASFGATSYAYGYVRCSDGSNGTNGALPTCANTAGFNNPGTTGFGTIMSYASGNWLARFESPNQTCTAGGVSAPCGVEAGPDGTPTPPGAADTVRSMNCVRQTIANFKSATTPPLDPAADDDGDGIPNGVEQAQGTNPRVKDNDVIGNNRLFAMQTYRDFVLREATAAEITNSVNALNGGQSKAAFIEALIRGAEYQDLGGPITRLYTAYFLRAPDSGGLNFWMTEYKKQNPWNFIAISNFFATSSEFRARYGSLTNEQFVTLIYQNILGRAPDASGFAFWTAELNSGRRSAGQVMADFSESPENKVTNKPMVEVAAAYQGLLRQPADATQLANYTPTVRSGGSVQPLISALLANPAYRSRFLP